MTMFEIFCNPDTEIMEEPSDGLHEKQKHAWSAVGHKMRVNIIGLLVII